ncbi:MAG TPA: serine/threonine-protein kinase [Planctomycetaceae bacterium]|nr:serine/threonine-protein kinase [Planctomycetaceae bacterium]
MSEVPSHSESSGFSDPESTQVDFRRLWPGAASAEAAMSQLLDPPRRDRDLGTFHNWPILRLVGAGGMALVLRGYDERLKRDVAIKVIRPEFTGSHTITQRFAREARLTAQVRHANVVIVYGVHDDPPSPYLIMEYLQGGTLQSRLKQGRLPESECVRLTSEIAAGLQAAHEHGLLHRDLKPSNIGFRNSYGPAVLMDFGLARGLSDTDPITEHGSLVGTPGYMSPEQVQMQPLDVRSDLFSLGTMLYQMATGRMPFPGDTPVTICHAVVHSAHKPANKVCPEVSDGLSALIDRLLEKSPPLRFPSATELLQALKDVNRPRRSAGMRLAAIAAATVIVIAGGLWLGSLYLPLPDGLRVNGGQVGGMALLGNEPRPAVEQTEAASSTAPWRVLPTRRPGMLSSADAGSWMLENDQPDYDWVMAEADLPCDPERDRFLLVSILEVAGIEGAGWVMKLADLAGSQIDTELHGHRETGLFALKLPPDFEAKQGWRTVRFFTEGAKGARIRFADVRFADDVPESFQVLEPGQ